MNIDEVASPEYRALLRERYESPGWGASGRGWASTVVDFMFETGSLSVLDYGCGRGTLKRALTADWAIAPLRVTEYDPGIVGKDRMPAPADIVVCTDVLEHVEPDRLNHVLAHLGALAKRGLFLNIATAPAREYLPDGRNAHLIVRDEDWWLQALAGAGLRPSRHNKGKGLNVWVRIQP
jgi:2-polyprenyl-3-methyl-5-hydroxy-6-metoxy-1,4-benzoquinol methylase